MTMKHISLAAAFTLALLFCAYSQTPPKVAQNHQTNLGPSVSPGRWQEYKTLAQAKRGEAAVRAWARNHKV
jgi:hypothetical protein